MGRLLFVHSLAMNQRSLVGLAVATLFLACTSNTTSLGGPDDAPASTASATEEDAATGTNESSDGLLAPDAGAPRMVCYGYSWDPVPSTAPCEYLLPERTNDDPRLDPKTWDPHDVIIIVMKGGGQDDVGGFVATKAACGTADGWYYVDPGDGGTRTLFGICPKSCDSLANNEGALLRLDATTHCDAW